MASIRKYPKGYRAQVYIKGQRDSGTFRTRREAEAWAFQREEELRGGAAHSAARTLKQALFSVSRLLWQPTCHLALNICCLA